MSAEANKAEWRFSTNRDADPRRETGSRLSSCPLLDIVLHSWTSVAPRAFQIQRALP